MWFLWIVLVILLWIYMDCCILRHEGFEAIPGPKGIFLLGNSLQIIMDPVKLFYYFRSLSNQYKYLYKLKVGPKKVLLIHNPEDIEAEMYAINLCVDLNLKGGYVSQYIHINSGSQAALHALASVTQTSKIAENCGTVLNALRERNKVILLWVPSHSDIEGNESADELAKMVISGTKNISKGFLYRFLKPWLQEGLLLSDGAKWQHRRKILTPAFHFNVLRCFRPIFEENSQKLVEQLSLEVGKSETNITTCISEFTLNSICETAMGTKLETGVSEDSLRYKEGIHHLGQIIVHRAQRVWIYLNWVFSLSEVGKKQEQLLQELSLFRDSVINKRRVNSSNNFRNSIVIGDIHNDSFMYGKKRLAMLDLLLEAEENGVINAKGIGEEVDTFMFEGHDTTATALQFAFMLLANNAKAQDIAIEEIDHIFQDSDRAATLNDLGKMKYLECCIKETLRLYPPVAFIMRKIDQDLKLKYHEIPAGIDCAILIYDLHRRNDQFVNPQEFNPERFLTEPTWHPYGYLPFSAGPRNCIGQKFAMMEMKVVLSTVLRHFRLLPVTKPNDVIFVTDLILRPSHPIYVKIENRM